MTNNDRLDYIRQYFEKQNRVLAEIPASISETTKGKLIRRFDGYRCGYKFVDGRAWIDRKDIHLFKDYPHILIHDQEEATNEN